MLQDLRVRERLYSRTRTRMLQHLRESVCARAREREREREIEKWFTEWWFGGGAGGGGGGGGTPPSAGTKKKDKAKRK